ncbi:hypothetical protein HUJ05_001383 [Dendroctonus ponderosae]|nr:hypothetical protein HUJ05_001383 [Dendroctonus ponderosae]
MAVNIMNITVGGTNPGFFDDPLGKLRHSPLGFIGIVSFAISLAMSFCPVASRALESAVLQRPAFTATTTVFFGHSDPVSSHSLMRFNLAKKMPAIVVGVIACPQQRRQRHFRLNTFLIAALINAFKWLLTPSMLARTSQGPFHQNLGNCIFTKFTNAVEQNLLFSLQPMLDFREVSFGIPLPRFKIDFQNLGKFLWDIAILSVIFIFRYFDSNIFAPNNSGRRYVLHSILKNPYDDLQTNKTSLTSAPEGPIIPVSSPDLNLPFTPFKIVL